MKAMINIDANDLVQMYTQEKMSLRSCARHFNTYKDVIKKLLVENGIYIKSKKDVVIERYKDAKWRDKDYLHTEYILNNRSSIDIANELGCDRSVVMDWLKKFNIPTRTTAETQLGKEPGNKGKGKRNSNETVTCACGCGEIIKRYNNSSYELSFVSGHRIKGENHPLYKPFSPNKDRKHEGSDYRLWRKAVFEKDNYTCASCGIRGGKIHAHHVLPVSKFIDKIHSVSNGRTLCVSCHKELHKAAREVGIWL